MHSKPILNFRKGLQRYTIWEDGLILDSRGNPPDEIGGLVELISMGGKVYRATRAEILATEFIHKEPGCTRLVFIDGNPNNLDLRNLTWDYPVTPEVKLGKSKKKDLIWEYLAKGIPEDKIVQLVGCCPGYVDKIRAKYNKTKKKKGARKNAEKDKVRRNK